MTPSDEEAIENFADLIEAIRGKYDISKLNRSEIKRLSYQFIYNEELKL